MSQKDLYGPTDRISIGKTGYAKPFKELKPALLPVQMRMQQTENVSRPAGKPTVEKILRFIREQETQSAYPGDIAEFFDCDARSLSYHIAQLSRDGAIVRGSDGKEWKLVAPEDITEENVKDLPEELISELSPKVRALRDPVEEKPQRPDRPDRTIKESLTVAHDNKSWKLMVEGLFSHLPDDPTAWPKAEREKWLRTIETVFDLFCEDDEPENDGSLTGRNFPVLLGDFSDAEILDTLIQIFWGDNNDKPICPKCDERKEFYEIGTREQYRCKICNHTFSLLSCTPVGSSKLNYREILAAIYALTDNPKITATQLAKNLGVQYRTGWFLKKRLGEYFC